MLGKRTVKTRPKGSFNYYVTHLGWGVSTFPGKSVTKPLALRCKVQ